MKTMSKKVVSLLLSMLMLMSLCVITLPVSAAGAIGTTITFDEDPALVVGTDYLVSAGVESGTTTDPVKGSGNVFYMKKTASGNPSITPYQTSATKGKQSNIEIYFDFMIPAADSNLFMELGGYHTDKSGRGTGAIFQINTKGGKGRIGVNNLSSDGVNEIGHAFTINTWYTAKVGISLAKDYAEFSLKTQGAEDSTYKTVRVTDATILTKLTTVSEFTFYTNTSNKIVYVDNLCIADAAADSLAATDAELAAYERTGPYNKFGDTVYSMYSDLYALNDNVNRVPITSSKYNGDNFHVSTGNFHNNYGNRLDPALKDGKYCMQITMGSKTPKNNGEMLLANGISQTKVNVSFSYLMENFMDSFGLYFSDLPVLTFDANNMKLMSNAVQPMEWNTWYDYNISVDTTTKTAVLQVKKSSEETWKTYSTVWNLLNQYSKTGAANYTKDLTSITKIGFAQYPNAGAPYTGAHGNAYLTNYMQNTSTTTISPSLKGLAPDMTVLPTNNTGVYTLGHRVGFTTQNVKIDPAATDKTVLTIDEDGSGYVLTNNTTGNAFPTFWLSPFVCAPSVAHRIQFQMSVPANGVISEFWLEAATNATGTARNTTVIKALRMGQNNGFFIEAFGATLGEALPFAVGDMLDIEVIYDPANEKAVTSIIAPDGRQFISDDATAAAYVEGIIGTTWTPLMTAQPRYTMAKGTSTKIEGFKWDITAEAPTAELVLGEAVAKGATYAVPADNGYISKKAIVIAALYDADHCLVDVNISEAQMIDADCAEITVSSNFDGSGSYVKVFVWDATGLSTLKALRAAKTITLS